MEQELLNSEIIESDKQEVAILLQNVSKTFGNKNVLHDVNLEITIGETLVIIGGSGSGKSVLLKCIIGLMLPDLGSSIKIYNNEVANLHISKRQQIISALGVLFQGNALFDSLPIWHNICFGLLQTNQITPKQALDLAAEKLDMVGLQKDILDLYPEELSGGMQKRVAIARAIANNPKLIFFDEPTAGLDPVTAKKISILIKNLCTDLKATAITITHDVRCMEAIADTVAAISEGTIIWNGRANDITKATHPYIKEFIER